MKKTSLSTIFIPFCRVNKKNTEEHFGLGFAITKYLIESHGGKIEVSSKIGVGCIFTVTLPK